MTIPPKIERVLVFCESKTGLLLLGALLLSFLLRFPSLAEPSWYGDEGITFTQAQTIRNGLSMYKDVYDNKPPLSYALASASFSIFGPTQWAARLVLLVWVLVTQIAFFMLARKVFGDRIAVISSFIFTLLISTPYLEGNIYNGEILMILPIILAVSLGLRHQYLWSGALFSSAFLIKVPALFDFFAFISYLWIIGQGLVSRELIKKYVLLGVGFAVILALVSLPFLINGTFSYYTDSAFFNNVGYTNYYNNFIIPNGLLLLKIIPVISLVLVFKFWGKARALKNEIKLLVLWIAFGFFGALLSGRPYTHYLIQIVPPLTITLALLGSNIYNTLKKGTKEKELTSGRTALIGTVVASFLVIVIGFQPQTIGLDYYPNYLKYMSGSMPVEQYQKSFDQKVTRNYVLAKYIEQKVAKNERVLILANEPFIYFLSGRFPSTRYSTYYHLNLVPSALDETRRSLAKKEPRMVIKEVGAEFDDKELNHTLNEDYHLVGGFEKVQIFTLKQP
jgi:4-amino-4-deoxy-L-arabinose transferase-like glycosyltransferase